MNKYSQTTEVYQKYVFLLLFDWHSEKTHTQKCSELKTDQWADVSANSFLQRKNHPACMHYYKLNFEHIECDLRGPESICCSGPPETIAAPLADLVNQTSRLALSCCQCLLLWGRSAFALCTHVYNFCQVSIIQHCVLQCFPRYPESSFAKPMFCWRVLWRG